MSLKETIKYYWKDPGRLFFRVGRVSFLRLLTDKQYVKLRFKSKLGYPLNLENPRSFNEKLNWLKLYYHNPLYPSLVDKYEVKKYVANIIGDQYIIPTLGVWNCFDDIDFGALPDQFVLKCTHDSGGLLIVKDKSQLNFAVARKLFNKLLKRNYYLLSREWPYKNIKPRIIAEAYMEDRSTCELRDYKFYVFNGLVRALYIATERGSGKEAKFDYFDADFNHLPFMYGRPNADVTPSKPIYFEEMKNLASKLSSGFPHVRVDFYEVNGNIYFGELTFFDGGGFEAFVPQEWDFKFGEWLALPSKSEKK